MYKDYLTYNHVTGVFMWIYTMSSTAVAGTQAGTLTKGYRYIQIDGVKIPAHQLAWWWETGEMVLGLDHIDRDKDNNRISNLRIVTHSENLINRSIQRNNKSGHKNISMFHNGKWKVEIKRQKVKYHVGYYFDLEQAISARDLWLQEYNNV